MSDALDLQNQELDDVTPDEAKASASSILMCGPSYRSFVCLWPW